MTIYDISEKAGVSIATVSRVLNGSSNVREKTKQKVLAVMKECGYTPNAFARGLGLNTMKTIGLLCADSSDIYTAKAIYYLERLLRENNYNSILCCSGYELENRKSSMELLLRQKVDAVILVGSSYVYEDSANNQYILDAAAKTPILIMNAQLKHDNVYSILSDDYESVYQATKYLLDSGIRDILFYYNTNSYSCTRKLLGYRQAMLDARPEAAQPLLHYYRGSHEDIPAMAEDLAQAAQEGLSFRGIIAADDMLALGAVKYAHEQHLNLPEDLAVIGYNNSMLTRICQPELSTIDNKLETLCRHMIHTLMGILNGEEMPPVSLFHGELIRRGTTK